MSTDRPPAPKRGLTPEEIKRRRSRSIAIGLALGALVLLFYVVTMAKLGPQVVNRPM
jgi:hypothetical protein